MTTIEANYAAGKYGKVVAIGLLPGADLVNGIKKVCEDENIHHGTVATVVGSLHKLTFSQVVSDSDERKDKFGPGFTEHRIVSGPLQVLSVQGIIYETEAGEVVVHIHGTFNDLNGRVHGGHLLPGENPVRNRLEAVVAEIKDVRLIERYDEKTAVYVFSPEQL